MNLPASYTLYGSSNDGNTVTFVKEGSTVQKPLFLVVTRKGSSFNQGTQSWSVPQIDYKVSRGLLTADNMPQPSKEIGTISVRHPVTGTDTDLDAVVGDLKALVNDPGFATAVKQQLIPMCCTEEVTP